MANSKFVQYPDDWRRVQYVNDVGTVLDEFRFEGSRGDVLHVDDQQVATFILWVNSKVGVNG